MECVNKMFSVLFFICHYELLIFKFTITLVINFTRDMNFLSPKFYLAILLGNDMLIDTPFLLKIRGKL